MVSKKLADLLRAKGIDSEKINKVITKETDYLSNIGSAVVDTKYSFDSYIMRTAAKAGYDPKLPYRNVRKWSAITAAAGLFLTLGDGSVVTTGVMVAGMLGFIYSSRFYRGISNTPAKSARYLIRKGAMDGVLDQYINGHSDSGYLP
jgi:hypothetical protein